MVGQAEEEVLESEGEKDCDNEGNNSTPVLSEEETASFQEGVCFIWEYFVLSQLL
jgi:hypothetical protein